MICPNCKSEIRDDALFCPLCGKPTGLDATGTDTSLQDEPQADATQVLEPAADATQVLEPAANATQADAAQVEAASGAPAGGKARKHRGPSRKAIVAIVVAGVVAAGAVGGGLYYHQQQVEQAERERQEELEREQQRAAALDALRHQDHPVTFTIQADGYEAEDGPIPVRITGTNLDGTSVDTTCHVSQDGSGTTLKSGSYEATVVASPLTKSGTLYATPDSPVSFEIPVAEEADAGSADGGSAGAASDSGDSADAGGSGAAATPTEGGTIQLAALDPLDQTDDVIDAAYQAALDGGLDAGTADAYRQAAVDVRTAAEKAKEEAEAKAAAERRAQDAHAAYSTFLQGTYDWGSDKGTDLGKCKFALVDLDGDGVDELLVQNPNASHANGYERLFGYNGGQVVELASGRDGFKIFRSGAILSLSVGRGSWDGTYRTLHNGKMSEVASFQAGDTPGSSDITQTFSDPGGESAPYCRSLKVNGTDTDLDTYLATVRKLADQEVAPNLVDNTAANRSQLLG
ncbi:MAG: zinc ribbon domain-containing protein [Olsenella sp.]|nr:zinc ribbon domain-containing protein [Olsenella sp.]